MGLFSTSPPLSEREASWIEASFRELLECFGAKFFLAREMVLPNDHYFPERFDGSIECLEQLKDRIAFHMGVDPGSAEVEYLPDESSHSRTGVAGLPEFGYAVYDTSNLIHHRRQADGRHVIQVRVELVRRPQRLVASLAHELAHLLLEMPAEAEEERERLELITDLTTVFCGMGIFNANAASDFRQWQDSRRNGWSVRRLGYLSEPQFAHALAYFSMIKGDFEPSWEKYLNVNLRAYLKASLASLQRECGPKNASALRSTGN